MKRNFLQPASRQFTDGETQQPVFFRALAAAGDAV